MAMRSNRFVFQLSPLVRPIAATDFGLLPTTNASVANDGEEPETWLARRAILKAKKMNGNGAGMPLSIAVRLLPTPKWQNANAPATHGEGGPDLQTAVAMLPTPSAGDEKDRGWQWNGSRTGKVLSLPGAVAALPTPNAGDGTRGVGKWNPAAKNQSSRTVAAAVGVNRGHKLQPAFAAWMMGFPQDWTESPFLDGEGNR